MCMKNNKPTQSINPAISSFNSIDNNNPCTFCISIFVLHADPLPPSQLVTKFQHNAAFQPTLPARPLPKHRERGKGVVGGGTKVKKNSRPRHNAGLQKKAGSKNESPLQQHVEIVVSVGTEGRRKGTWACARGGADERRRKIWQRGRQENGGKRLTGCLKPWFMAVHRLRYKCASVGKKTKGSSDAWRQYSSCYCSKDRERKERQIGKERGEKVSPGHQKWGLQSPLFLLVPKSNTELGRRKKYKCGSLRLAKNNNNPQRG